MADIRAWLVACVLFAVALAVSANGVLAPVTERLFDFGFAILKRPASGQVVLVQIDARSVREINAWPWPRRTYAKAIGILHDAGASTIALDVELPGVTAGPSEDPLARAVIRAQGTVVFRPGEMVGASEPGRLPVLPRRVSTGPTAADGVYDASFAARIAQAQGRSADATDFDYSIDPASIPRVSFLDVYDANFDFSALRGKRVIIGVTASSLGQPVVVPGHGVMPKAEVTAMMADAFLQRWRLSNAGVPGQALVALLAVLFMWPGKRSWSFGDLIVPSVAAMWGAVVFSALIFEYAHVLLDPVPCAVVVAGSVVFAGLRDLARRIVVAIRARTRSDVWRILADLLDDELPERTNVVRRNPNSQA
jgi:CHASE2 domain-containing sensor protein